MRACFQLRSLAESLESKPTDEASECAVEGRLPGEREREGNTATNKGGRNRVE